MCLITATFYTFVTLFILPQQYLFSSLTADQTQEAEAAVVEEDLKKYICIDFKQYNITENQCVI